MIHKNAAKYGLNYAWIIQKMQLVGIYNIFNTAEPPFPSGYIQLPGSCADNKWNKYNKTANSTMVQATQKAPK